MADLRGSVKWMLFFSSYIPLYPILAVKHWQFTVTVPHTNLLAVSTIGGVQVPIVSVAWVTLAIISLVFLVLTLSVRQDKEPKFKQIESYRSRNDLITSYLLVYIFPFVILDYTKTINWIAFITFFLVVGIIQVRSNQLHVNPILALLNFDIYEIDDGEREIMVVSKKDLGSVESLRAVELSEDVYLAV